MSSRRRYGGLALLVIAMVLFVPGVARSEEADDPAPEKEGGFLEEFAVGLDLSAYSKYVWRGVNLVDDLVLQPSLDLSAYGFGVNVWGNLDLTDENGDQWEFSEVDLTFSYSFALDPVDVSVGAAVYFFPTIGGNTTELFVAAGLDTVLAPTLTLYQDVDEVDGTYVALSIAHAFDDPFRAGEAAGVSPELSASLGYGSRKHNEAYYGEDSASLADLTLGLVVPWSIGDTTTLAASACYSVLVDSGVRDQTSDPDNFWVGLSLSFSF
jgi:hypothetical protein